MDKSYYFVLEPDGVDDGPYKLPEIQRRVEIGLISKAASLCKVGETTYVPLTDGRYAHLLEPAPRAATGTMPPPAEPKVDPLRATFPVESLMPKMSPPAVAAMPPGFVPPVPAQPVAPPAPAFVPAPAPAYVPAPTYAAPVPAAFVPAAAATPAGFVPAPAFVPAPPVVSSPPVVASPAPAPAPTMSSLPPPMPVVAAPIGAPLPPSPLVMPMPVVGSAPVVTTPSVPAAKPATTIPVPPLPTMTNGGAVPTAAPNASTFAPHLTATPNAPTFAPHLMSPSPSPSPSHAQQAPAPVETMALPPVEVPQPAALKAMAAARTKSASNPPPKAMPAATPAAPTPVVAAPAPAPVAAPLPPLPSPPVAYTPVHAAPVAHAFVPVAATTPILPPPPVVAPIAAAPEALHPGAEGSAPLHMPTMALALYHSEPQQSQQVYEQVYEQQPYDSAYQPPIYEQPVYDQYAPDSTAATPRVAEVWWKNKRNWAIAGGGLALLIIIIAIAATRGGGGGAAKDAMVRVTTPSMTGAGFFIQGPDNYAYVATANHVVDRGDRVLIERDVGEEKRSFVEAYPETEIVAADPDADLAIIRIKNLDASRFPRLSLAEKPTKDEKILSYGYPGSSLATKAGLVSKDGKVLSLVSFPAYDERYQRVLRDNAVDGLLISTDIEPGMSGGPTMNDSGEVVGVNVTKDRAHTGQNGAVSVVALRALLAKVKPANERPAPTNDDVVKLLDKIQSDYLLLPIDERKKVRETEFVNSGDLPALRQFVGEVRREERNTDTSFIAKYRLSGQAALGIFFARMPGKLLETYRAPSTTGPLAACELANRRLTSFLGDLSTVEKKVEPKVKGPSCDDLAVRPLAWDLVAATLQWEGKEQRYTVTKLDKLDDEGQLYRASVRIAGTSNLIELWFGTDQNALRLKLFDPTGSLYAIKSPRNVSSTALQGTWSMKRPRVTDAFNKNAEIESTDTVSVSITDGKVSIRYVVAEHYFGAGNRAQVFKCNGKRTIETGLLQSFSGNLENGVAVAFPDKEAEPMGPDAAYCLSSHRADRIVAIKLAGDQLVMYRTDGLAYPEAVQLTRDNAAVVPAPSTPPPSRPE